VLHYAKLKTDFKRHNSKRAEAQLTVFHFDDFVSTVLPGGLTWNNLKTSWETQLHSSTIKVFPWMSDHWKLLCSMSQHYDWHAVKMNFNCLVKGTKETSNKTVPQLKSLQVLYDLVFSLIPILSLLLIYSAPKVALWEMPWHLKMSQVVKVTRNTAKIILYCWQ